MNLQIRKSKLLWPITVVLVVSTLSCDSKKDGKSYGSESMKMDEKSNNSQASKVMADSATAEKAPVSSSAAKPGAQDSNRKFIRTADLKFQVKNVIKSTYAIEDIVGSNGGFVTYTHLESTRQRQSIIPVSEDSSVESNYFTVVNTMVIRVPNNRLDTALKSIGKWVDYMDYRTIKADDVSLQMLANRLSQRRNTRLNDRITTDIDRKGKRIRATTAAEETASGHQEQSDEAMISNLALADQVKYSTVNINLYQREEVKKILVANEKSIKSFEPGFGRKLVESLKFGWEAFSEVILFFVKLWWLLLVAVLVYMIYKRFKPKSTEK